MAVPLAELFISVGADVSGAVAGLTALGTQLEGTTAKFQAAAPAALLLEGAAVGVGAGLFEATKVAASFEQAMADVRAVMTPTEIQQFGGALGDLAVRLGQQTVFSAREAAAGIGELIRAGIPAEAVLGGAADAALHLAAATGISVASAATTAAQTMNAFHKTTGDLTGVVDNLAGTANATAATMSDLQFGLQVVSATANTMGLSFQDTTEAIGLFVNAGITGATAGTGLRQMLLELIPNTKPAREEMLKLGITTKDGGNAFFDAAGHVRNLAGISQVLQNALKGMSDQQRIAALNTLFTRDAINSATILAQQGAAGVNQLADAIGQISAADTAAIRLGTLQGAMNNLGSSMETVQIIIGNLFLPTITSIANNVRGVVDSFSALDPELQKAIVFLTAIGGAAAGLVGSVVLLAPFIAALGPAFAALGGALVAVVPLFLPLIAVAGLLIAAWQADLGGIQGVVADGFKRLPEALGAVSGVFQRAADLWSSTVVPAVRDIGSALGERLTPTATALAAIWQDRLLPGFAELGVRLGPVMIDVMGRLSDLWDTRLLPTLQVIGSTIDDRVIPGFAQFAASALDTANSALPGLISSGVNLIELYLKPAAVATDFLGSAMTSTVIPALQSFGSTISNQVIPPVQSLLNEGLRQIQPAMQGFVDSLIQFSGDVGTGFIDFFQTQLPLALKAFGDQLQSVQPLFGALAGFFGAIFNVMGSLADLGGTALRGLFENVLLPGFTSLGQALAPLQPVFASTTESLSAMAESIGLIGTRLGPVVDFFVAAKKALDDFALSIQNTTQNLPDFLKPSSGPVGTGPVGVGGGLAGRGASFQPTAFNPGGGAGGPIVAINQLFISSEAEAKKFLAEMAAVFAASANRVSAPPDNSAFPQLSVTV